MNQFAVWIDAFFIGFVANGPGDANKETESTQDVKRTEPQCQHSSSFILDFPSSSLRFLFSHLGVSICSAGVPKFHVHSLLLLHCHVGQIDNMTRLVCCLVAPAV